MPVSIAITRPTYTDVDSLPAATFNGVAISSAVVPDATGATEGVLRLAGDLAGTAAAPALAASGASAGAYGGSGANIPSITVDAKGRITLVANRALTAANVGAAAAAHTHAVGDITGLGSMAVNSLIVVDPGITANVNQTGSAPGAALIFDTPNAPKATLSAGKWLVLGVVTARMSDTSGEVTLQFSDSAGANRFGAGASKLLPTTRDSVTVIGFCNVTSGTREVFFWGTPAAGSTLNFGSAAAVAYPGYIVAFKLEGA